MTSTLIREERPEDTAAIRHLVEIAFQTQPYSNGREGVIIDALRAADALAISLIAEVAGEVVGQVAFSKVTIDGTFCGWYGLGPVAVLPAFQAQGIGSELIQTGLQRLQALGAKGCVLLGNPKYYERFGFKVREGLTLEGAPPEYFMALPFGEPVPRGTVQFHAAFEA